MIQDIAPYRLDTAYTPRPPRAGSLLCLLHGKSVLAAESGGLLRLPRLCCNRLVTSLPCVSFKLIACLLP